MAQVRRQRTARYVLAHAGRNLLTPGTCVRDVRRIGVAAGDANSLADASIAADSRLLIIDAGLAGKPHSGIGEIGHAEIEIDICELRTDAGCKSELGEWLRVGSGF